jgi:hypothetical protein
MQAGYSIEPQAANAGGQDDCQLSIAIYADRTHVQAQMTDDARAAGFDVRQAGPVDALLGEGVQVLGDVVLLDCPDCGPAQAAALCRLDMRAARAGAHLVVSTSVASLDAVFACLDQSNPQILVDPTRAERVIALGRVLARVPNLRLRELSEEDRMTLLRLTEQVGQIAQRLERIESGPARGASAFAFEAAKQEYKGPENGDGAEGRLVRATRPSLPDPRLVRRMIRQRQLRGRFFDAELFADPAWDILLDLTAARAEHLRVSVTSLCIASGVPPTTALRWIGQMTDAGLLERVEDDTDKRRAFIQLSDKAAAAMAQFFAEIANDGGALI